ncbi:hypothetical protein FACS1894201_08630 [Bacteroidia bacterium]|nr:hypothetical protein FACS1894201_08630 [Bacteroidia bacterium]
MATPIKPTPMLTGRDSTRFAKVMGSRLDKETSDKVSFITFIVPEFAAAYKMNIQDA